MKITIKRTKESTVTTDKYCCDKMSVLIQGSAAVAVHLQSEEFRIPKIFPEVISYCPYCGKKIVFENK